MQAKTDSIWPLHYQSASCSSYTSSSSFEMECSGVVVVKERFQCCHECWQSLLDVSVIYNKVEEVGILQ
jgi:hypothetical protein